MEKLKKNIKKNILMVYKKQHFKKSMLKNIFLKVHVAKRHIFKKSTLQIHLETDI